MIEKREKMSKYNLEVDSEQLKHISKALDFFARIQTGQISELVNPYMIPLPDADYKEVDSLLKELKKQMLHSKVAVFKDVRARPRMPKHF